MPRRLGRAYRDTRGSEVLEFALVLPILLVLMAGILDMGFLFNNYEVITNAAREGARLAALPRWSDADVEARVHTYVSGAGLNVANVTTNIDRTVTFDVGGETVHGVKVAVTYPYTYMMLGPLAGLIQGGGTFTTTTLSAASTMRTEVVAGL